MPKIVIIFAHQAEAAVTLKRLKINQENDSSYRFKSGWIVISGVGGYAAQLAVSKHVAQVDEIWNFGFSGALQSGENVGNIYEIANVEKYIAYQDDLTRKAFPPINLQKNGKSLISSDFPIHDEIISKALAKNFDLVDMEGYALAYSARFFNKKCCLYKIVSDFASPNGSELIRKKSGLLSEMISEKIFYLLNE